MISSTICGLGRARCYVVFGLLLCMAVLSAVQAGADSLFKGTEAIPSDAIVLFDGKDLSQWIQARTGEAPKWKVENGYAVPDRGDICTKQKFSDCQLHVEFAVPLMANAHGEARANSGVFFMGWVYEVQILDSYGKDKWGNGDCASIYNFRPPSVNACRPPEQWQTYEIIFHAPRFDANGKKTANARLSVIQNGVLVQDNVEVPHATPNPDIEEPKEPAPIWLQDHGCAVRFRNVWVRPLGESK